MSNPTYNVPESTLERVRKLLAKAEGTDNEHERDAFTKAAASLMAKYGIEQAMVGAGQEQRPKPMSRRFVLNDGKYIAQRTNLLCWLAQAMRCKTVYYTVGRSYTVVQVYGFEVDVERAELMYTSLLLQMTSALNDVKAPEWANARAYRNSWIKGYVAKVTAMVREREKRAVQEADAGAVSGTSTALVLRDRNKEVEELYKAENPKVRTVKSAGASNADAYHAGVKAGAQANLGGASVENRRNALTR